MSSVLSLSIVNICRCDIHVTENCDNPSRFEIFDLKF